MNVSDVVNVLFNIIPTLLDTVDVSTNMPSNGKTTCHTLGCLQTASFILKNMDSKVNPCDDFYKFACGGFVKNTVIPGDRVNVNTLEILNDKVIKKLRSSIEEEIAPNEPKPFKLAKTLYKSCMNKTLIQKQGLEPLQKMLNDLGGWPVLMGDKWNEADFNWKESVYKLHKMGHSPNLFFKFSICTNSKNSTMNIIELDRAYLYLSDEYFVEGLDNEIVKAYYNYMIELAEILGANRSQAAIELKQSLEFEMTLAHISASNEDSDDAIYNSMTVAELKQKFPTIPWIEYFNVLLAPSATVKDDEPVILKAPNFITGLEHLLKQTPRRVVANYMMWRTVANSVSYLPDNVRAKQLNFLTVQVGKTELEPRWKECLDTVSYSLPISISALYVRKYFDEYAKKMAIEMVSDIKAEFTKIVKTVDWMDEVTRKAALDKVEAMAAHVAYPDELLDDKKLEEYYRRLDISEGSYMQSMLNLTLFDTLDENDSLRQPVNKSDWIIHGKITEANAFYTMEENSILINAGILQGASFSKYRPQYMNYGAIGFLIGHEITHGFDNQGRQYNKDGNLVEWWAEETKEEYLKKAECIINQYGNYTLTEVSLNLNGKNTLGENIADNGAIKTAYPAYIEWVRRNRPEPLLPGLKYSPQQMFWISAANMWCSKDRPEILKVDIITDSHSPAEFRVNGPLSNSPEFAKDFNCPIGSKMNPEKKCAVW